MEILLFIAVFGGLLATVLLSLYRRARQVHALVSEGLPISGVVTRKHRFTQKGRARFTLTYEYTPDGRTRQGRAFVSREQFDSHAEGQMLQLRYLAGKPAASAPEFILDRTPQPLR